MDPIEQGRQFMKSSFGVPGAKPSDQQLGKPQPPLQLPVEESAMLIDLPEVDSSILRKTELFACLTERRSRRQFTSEPLALAELSFLLWATQGVQQIKGENYATLRPAPSAGARHPFETYLLVNRAEGLEIGIYRYLPLSHQLAFLFTEEDLPEKMTEAAVGQRFVGDSAAVFAWSCVPYRGEWRYQSKSHKVMLIDAGHLCQNLYLAAEAIGCGTCGIGAYMQEAMDQLFRVDGRDEFIVYLAPVGRVE